MNFIYRLKLSGKFKQYLIGCCIVVIVLVVAIISIFTLTNRPVIQTAASAVSSATQSSSQIKSSDINKYLEIANKAESEYKKTAKNSDANDANTIKQVRYEAVYNDIFSNRLKEIMKSVKIPDAEVTELAKSGKYNKLARIVTVHLALSTSSTVTDKTLTGDNLIKLYDSDSYQKLKVGDTFAGGKITKIKVPTTSEMLDDAKGYLVSIEAVKQVDALTLKYLGGK